MHFLFFKQNLCECKDPSLTFTFFLIYSLDIIPLHSSVTLEEQNKAFKKPTKGFRKVSYFWRTSACVVRLWDSSWQHIFWWKFWKKKHPKVRLGLVVAFRVSRNEQNKPGPCSIIQILSNASVTFWRYCAEVGQGFDQLRANGLKFLPCSSLLAVPSHPLTVLSLTQLCGHHL